MNTHITFFLISILFLVSCGQKGDNSAVDATADAVPTTSDTSSELETTQEAPAQVKPTLALSSEMEATVVCVRVSIASTLQSDHAGVILRPDSFDPPIPSDSTKRLIATIFANHDEQALRDKNCLIQILRNKNDSQGTKYSTLLKGSLVHFDAATHLAVVQCSEDFPYRLDSGLLPGTSTDALHLLQTSCTGQDSSAPGMPPNAYRNRTFSRQFPVVLPPMTVSLQPTKLNGEILEPAKISATDSDSLSSAAVLASDGKLAGFAIRTQVNGWEFHSFSTPKVGIQGARYLPKSVEFTNKGPGYFNVTLRGELQDPLSEFGRCVVAVQKLPSPKLVPVSDPASEVDPIDAYKTTQEYLKKDGTMTFPLDLPDASEPVNHLVQVQLLTYEGQILFHAAPFLVTAKARGAGLYLDTVGISNNTKTTGSPDDNQAPGKELTTESQILYGLPICEGREILFRLEQSPFWKRLSVERGEWLPLPQEELSSARLTGNKDAIFVLQPASREISRYDSKTLELEVSAKLPEGIAFQDVAVGCLSTSAPVAVIGDKGVIACDPSDLAASYYSTLAGPGDLKIHENSHLLASGDGRALGGFDNDKLRPDRKFGFKYQSVLMGFGKYLPGTNQREMTVTPSFTWDGYHSIGLAEKAAKLIAPDSTGRGRFGVIANSPIYFWISHANASMPPQCTLYSYLSGEPWVTFPVPEMADLPLVQWGTLSKRVWFDPYSMSLAVWHHDRTITTRTIPKPPVPKTPVLLNFPDTFVPRAGTFKFTPLLLGDPGSKITVSSVQPGFRLGPNGEMEWHVPASILPNEVSFDIKLSSGSKVSEAEFTCSLQMGGIKPVAAVTPTVDAQTAANAIDQIGHGIKSSVPMVPLYSRYYLSERPIKHVLPGLNDYLGLLLEDKTLALFSLKERKIVGSRQLGDTISAFMAGDTVLIYDTVNRSLTRHSLPDFNITGRVLMPRKATLIAIGAGETPDSPVTLVLHEIVDQQGFSTPSASVTFTQARHSVLIVDKQTLAPGRWAQFTPKNKSVPNARNTEFVPEVLTLFKKDFPMLLPTSSDGRIVALPKGHLIVTPSMTTDQVFPSSAMLFGSFEALVGTASPTADRFFYDGSLILGGQASPRIGQGFSTAMSPCGNYITHQSYQNGITQIKVISTNGLRPLFNLTALDIFKIEDGNKGNAQRQVMPLGDKNLIAVISRGGTIMQLIDFDLSAIFKQAAHDSVVVTSQPFPLVVPGRSLKYQIQVNDPQAVDSYRLRDKVPGADIDNLGNFTFQAPTQVNEARHLTIGIVIQLKNGDVVSHEFPIYIIPFKPTPGSPPPGRTTI